MFFNVLFINSCNIGYRKIPKISPGAYIIQRCEERIYCYSVILLSLIKIWKANVEIIYSLVLTSLSRKQPVELVSVNLFVKS